MDVLNTYGGGIDVSMVVFAILFLVLALFLFVIACAGDEEFAFYLGLVCALFSILSAVSTHEPVRHEVTLRPGYVIDATKYEVVEQRGEIYVIEERE